MFMHILLIGAPIKSTYLFTYLLTPSVGSDRVGVRSAKVCVLEKSLFRLTDYFDVDAFKETKK